MKLNRSELREKIMIVLYQIYFYRQANIEYKVEDVIKENLEIENDFVSDIVYGVLENEEYLDKTINKYIENWTINRLGKTDQAILRLSAYELLFYDTPHIVAINEGIELSKKYSDEKIVKMTNAILDNIMNNEELKNE